MMLQGAYNYGIMRDLFGDGIFAVDGHKSRHQRKLASYEFSTRVLRDLSSAVFRTNAAKLVSKITVAATALKSIDLQVSVLLQVANFLYYFG
jgi:cytochrome P450